MIDQYLKKGYTILKTPYDIKYIDELKNEINDLFSDDESASLGVNSIKNEKVFNKIINILNTSEIQRFTESLSKHFNTTVSLLPNFHIMRNYHVNRLTTNRIGWHRDVASEFKYPYCKDQINDQHYVFGKVGIFLQENSENYGGAVDVIPSSHLDIKKNRINRYLKNLKLHSIIQLQKKFLNLYKLLPEKYYIYFLNAIKTKAKPGEPIFFDSRIHHRGSPIKDQYLKSTKKLGDMHILVPQDYTKISIYAYFGSTEGADSYMYARTKRVQEGYKKYFTGWKNEIERYKNYKNLYDTMTEVVKPLYRKYKNN